VVDDKELRGGGVKRRIPGRGLNGSWFAGAAASHRVSSHISIRERQDCFTSRERRIPMKS
jgi:hypothetical protein